MTSVPANPFAHRARRLWHRVIVDVPADLTDAAADALAEVSGSGVEIVAAPPSAQGTARERLIGYLAVNGADGGEGCLRDRLISLAARYGGAEITVVDGGQLLEEDWGSRWKERFHPFHATSRLVIKPTWETYEPQAGEVVVEMDAGLAFGTGQHESTRLALAAIEEVCIAAPPARVLDIGTGTGVLAMAAALRGAGRVTAIDTDPDAVQAARENVARNGLAARVEVAGVDLHGIPGTFDLIAANITADVLLALQQPIARRLAPGGTLVLAGLLAGAQAAEVRAVYERHRLRCAGESVEGEWAALVLRREEGPDVEGEEIFEIVDEQGRVVGCAPRSLCHRTPSLLHRAAHVVVTDGRGRIYLQKRSADKDIQPGKWDTSVGGHLAAGEDHEAGARREMLEELGLSGELRFLYRFLWRTSCESELVETWLHVATREPRPLPGEIDEGRWFTVAEAAGLVASGEATPSLADELRRLAEAGIL